ncbi:hypothetical protein SUGI_0031730 [Cryptomeria japonica]|nr:hypothetical protein SUGI_0031730 [Cryptomeria japonica]
MKIYISPILLFLPTSPCGNGKVLREYIGAEGLNIKFSDVPINENVEFHFILSFPIDYTSSDRSPSPTNGKLNVQWDKKNLSPADVLSINAVSTLSQIITGYHLDGIDIDYEHFDHSDPNTFAECIGKLIVQLKQKKVMSMASIAPYEDEGPVQSHYKALWRKCGRFIDYVKQFLEYFDT